MPLQCKIPSPTTSATLASYRGVQGIWGSRSARAVVPSASFASFASSRVVYRSSAKGPSPPTTLPPSNCLFLASCGPLAWILTTTSIYISCTLLVVSCGTTCFLYAAGILTEMRFQMPISSCRRGLVKILVQSEDRDNRH
jgi:hypothetical protein